MGAAQRGQQEGGSMAKSEARAVPGCERPVDDDVLRFAMGDVYPRRAFPWVTLASDGRVEQDGQVRQIPAELAARALGLARSVMGFARTEPDSMVHDPDSKVMLEVRQPDGSIAKATLLWGRSSRCDLLFYPIDGEQAREVFREFVDVLRAIRYGEREPAPLPAGEGKSVWDIVQLLVRTPPTHLSQLERVLGPLSFGASPHDEPGHFTRPPREAPTSAVLSTMVRRVSVELQDGGGTMAAPVDGSPGWDPPLARVSIEFPYADIVFSLLERFCGAGQRFRGSPAGTGTRFGNFVSFDHGEHFVWYAAAPEWPPTSVLDEARRWLSKRLKA